MHATSKAGGQSKWFWAGRSGLSPQAGDAGLRAPARLCMIGKSSVARRQFAQADDGGTMGGDAALRIGFLGAGKMATALARGWLAARLVRAEDMLASDPLIEAQQAFHANTGVRA